MSTDSSIHTFLKEQETTIFALLKEICEIPAPTFHEERKMLYLTNKLNALGLTDIEIDNTGNATGKLIMDPSHDNFVLISAHGDTACEAPLPIQVKEKSGHFFSHGICDNTAGVTAVLSFLDFIKQANIQLKKNYLIGFTVGEEGLGAKRGMKGLMTEHSQYIQYVINVESHDIGRVTTACVGQVRGKITISTKQKGAHSWRNFGEPNAVVLLAQIISDFSEVSVPENSTYNFTAIKGGKSINAIPNEAECLFEFRAENQEHIDLFMEQLKEINQKYCQGGIESNMEILATTKAASLPKDHPIFTITQQTQKALDIKPYFKIGNTDGDVPLSLGIPTVTLGASNGFATHSLEEHMEKDTYLLGIEQVISIILALDKDLEA